MSVTEMKRHVNGCSDVMIRDAKIIDFSWSNMLNFGEIKRESFNSTVISLFLFCQANHEP